MSSDEQNEKECVCFSVGIRFAILPVCLFVMCFRISFIDNNNTERKRKKNCREMNFFAMFLLGVIMRIWIGKMRERKKQWRVDRRVILSRCACLQNLSCASYPSLSLSLSQTHTLFFFSLSLFSSRLVTNTYTHPRSLHHSWFARRASSLLAAHSTFMAMRARAEPIVCWKKRLFFSSIAYPLPASLLFSLFPPAMSPLDRLCTSHRDWYIDRFPGAFASLTSSSLRCWSTSTFYWEQHVSLLS